MASLKEIKTRIASIRSTRKITSAMEVVASSKLYHIQNAIESMLLYAAMLEHILKAFPVSTPDTNTPSGEQRPVKRIASLVFSSDSSLCGGFNANVAKLMQHTIDEYHMQGLTDKDIIIYPIRRKVYESAKKRGCTCVYPCPQLADKPSFEECRSIAMELSQKWLEGEFDRVEIIYHHFKNAGSQILQRKGFLPIDLEKEVNADSMCDLSSNITTKAVQEYLKRKGQSGAQKSNNEAAVPLNDNFIIEPDLRTVSKALVSKLLNNMTYTVLLDSNAPEHAARVVAMQTATDNADDLLRGLNLQCNKSCQAVIMSELFDIVGDTVNN